MEKPEGSNSIETLLSRVKRRTEIKFLIRDGDTRTSFKRRDLVAVGMKVCAWCVTGTRAPLPTVMVEEDGWRVEGRSVPGEDDMCDVAPVSKYQSAALGG